MFTSVEREILCGKRGSHSRLGFGCAGGETYNADGPGLDPVRGAPTSFEAGLAEGKQMM